MRNRLVDRFVVDNATSTLQNIFLLRTEDSQAIVAKLTPEQRVMINKHQGLLRLFVYDLIDADFAWFKSFAEFSFSKFQKNCESGVLCPDIHTDIFPQELETFYVETLEPLLKSANDMLTTAVRVKQLLDVKSTSAYAFVRSHFQQCDNMSEFPFVAQTMALELMMSDANKDTTLVSLVELFKSLSKIFPTIPHKHLSTVINIEFLAAVREADRTMKALTPLDNNQRATVIRQSIAHLQFLPMLVRTAVYHVLDRIQMSDRKFISNLIYQHYVLCNEVLHKIPAYTPFINYRSVDARIEWMCDILDTIFTNNYIDVLAKLPIVKTLDGETDLGSDARIYNRKGMIEATHWIAQNKSLDDYRFEWHTIEPPAFDYYQLGYFLLGCGGVIGGLLFLYCAYAECRYQLFRRAVFKDVSARNNEYVDFLKQLPLQRKTILLTEIELKIYAEAVAEIEEVDIKNAALLELRHYKEIIDSKCGLSRTDFVEIEEPLTITGMTVAGNVAAETYEFKDYIAFVDKCSDESRLVYSLHARDIVMPDNEEYVFNRGYPDFLQRFVDEVRGKLVERNTVSVGIRFRG